MSDLTGTRVAPRQLVRHDGLAYLLARTSATRQDYVREVAIKLLRIYHRDRWRISPRKLGASVDDVVLDARKPPPPEDAAIIAEQCSPIAARIGYHAEGHTARTSPIEMLSGASRLS